MKNKLSLTILLVILSSLLFIACRKKDNIAAPDILVNFETQSYGMSATENAVTIKLQLTAATTVDVPVIINVTEDNVSYDNGYTTNPAVDAGKIRVIIPAGNNEASFTVTKKPGAFFVGDEKLVFDIFLLRQ